MATVQTSLTFTLEVDTDGLERYNRKLEGGAREIDAAASTLVASVTNTGDAPDTVPLRRALLQQSGVLEKVKRGAGWEPPKAAATTKKAPAGESGG